MTKEPVNLERLENQIVLDCSLLRWFAFNGRRDEVLAAPPTHPGQRHEG